MLSEVEAGIVEGYDRASWGYEVDGGGGLEVLGLIVGGGSGVVIWVFAVLGCVMFTKAGVEVQIRGFRLVPLRKLKSLSLPVSGLTFASDGVVFIDTDSMWDRAVRGDEVVGRKWID